MEENKNITTLLEEDDGEDLVGKKVTLEDIAEKEKAEEEQAKPVLTKEEQKLRDKKANKLTAIIIGSIVGIVAIAGIIVTVTKPKFIRDLPFRTDGKTAADLNDVDYQEGEWYVANQQAGGQGIILDICNMYDKPTARGNAVITFNTDDTITVLGDVYDTKTNKALEWYCVQKDGKKGYIKAENIYLKFEESVYFEEIVETQNEKSEVDDKEKHAFYQKKSAERMAKVNEDAKEKSTKTNNYLDTYNKLKKLNKQIDLHIAYITDEAGNEIEVPYEYTPEEWDALIKDRDNTMEELTKIKEEMGMTSSEN